MGILITGYTGLLGRALFKQLYHLQSKLGRIHFLSRSKNIHLNLEHQVFLDYNIISEDLNDLIKIPNDIETIIHIAGEKFDTNNMSAINHLATLRLAETASKFGVKRFIHISSVGVYGAAPFSGIIHEDFERTPNNAYEKSKNEGELAVLKISEETGMECVVIQPTNVISHVGEKQPLLNLIRAIYLRRFAWFGNSVPYSNYITAENVGASIIAATLASSVKSGSYIVNTPMPLTQMVESIASELKVSSPKIRFPIFFGSALANCAGIVESVFNKKIPFDENKLLELTNTNLYSAEKFHSEFTSASFVPLTSTIKNLVNKYKDQDLL